MVFKSPNEVPLCSQRDDRSPAHTTRSPVRENAKVKEAGIEERGLVTIRKEEMTMGLMVL